MTITAPTTAAEAAAVLLDLAELEGIDNPTPARRDGDPTDLDPWEALTRSRHPGLDAEVARRSRDYLTRSGINSALPPVVVTLPLAYLPRGWARVNGNPTAEVLTADGYTGWEFQVGRPARPSARPRLAIVGRPEELPPTPRSSHALVVAVLAAERAAAELDRWAGGLDARTAKRAANEADTYRTLAARYSSFLADSFAWLEGLDVPRPEPALKTTPATLRGTARLGIT